MLGSHSTSKNLHVCSENTINLAKFFSPQIVHQILYQNASKGHQDGIKIKPQSFSKFAAVCIADISGFTKLASSLSAEILKKHINDYFTKIISIIHKYGGDVVKFCGDAVIVIWPIDTFASSELKSIVVLLAAICSLELLEVCGNYQVHAESNFNYQQKCESFCLSLHCGISCGKIHGLIVGENQRFEFLISGEVLSDVGDALSFASSGEIVLSHAALSHVWNVLKANEVVQVVAGSSTPSENKFYKLTGGVKIENDLLVDHFPVPRMPQNLDDSYVSNSTVDPNFQYPYRSQSCASTELKYENQQASNLLSSQLTNSNKLEASSRDVCHHFDTSIHNERIQLNATSTNHQAHKPTAGHIRNSIVSVKRRLSTTIYQLSATLLSEKMESSAKNVDGTSKDGQRLQSDSISAVIIPKILEIRDHKLHNSSKLCAEEIFNLIFFPGSDALLQFNHHKSLTDDQTISLQQKDHFKEALQVFLQEPALLAMQRGVLVMLSEMRHITTVFINIFGLDSDFLTGDIQRIQKVMSVLLNATKKHDGFLRQFVVDDKGCVAILCFGLKALGSTSNSSDAFCCNASIVNYSIRAVQSSLYVTKMLLSMGCSTNIGIAQGLVYCGLVGALNRGEYAVMGASVNLAARLMGINYADMKTEDGFSMALTGNILTDSAVYKDTISVFHFIKGPSLILKGHSSAVFSYTVVKQNFQSVLCQQLHLLGSDRLEYIQDSVQELSKRMIYNDSMIANTTTLDQIVDSSIPLNEQIIDDMVHSFSSCVSAAYHSTSNTTTLEPANLECKYFGTPVSTDYQSKHLHSSYTGTGSGSDSATLKVQWRLQSASVALSRLLAGRKVSKMNIITDNCSSLSQSRKSSAASLPATPILDRSSNASEIVHSIGAQPNVGKSIFILDPTEIGSLVDLKSFVGRISSGLGKTTMIKNFARLFKNSRTSISLSDENSRIVLCDLSLPIDKSMFRNTTDRLPIQINVNGATEDFWVVHCIMNKIFDVITIGNITCDTGLWPDIPSGSKQGITLFRKSVHRLLSISAIAKSPQKYKVLPSSSNVSEISTFCEVGVSLQQRRFLSLVQGRALGDIFDSFEIIRIFGQLRSINIHSPLDELIPYLFGKSIELVSRVPMMTEGEISSSILLILCNIFAASLCLALRTSSETTLPFVLLLDSLHLCDLPSVFVILRVSQLLHRSSGILIVSSMQSFFDSILLQQSSDSLFIEELKHMISDLPSSQSQIIRLQPFSLSDISCMIQLVCPNLHNLSRIVKTIHNSTHSALNGNQNDLYSTASITSLLSKDIFEKYQNSTPYNIVCCIQCLKLGIDQYIREREYILEDVTNGNYNFIFKFDQLDVFDQTILKISSVIGLKFDNSTLFHVCCQLGILADEVTSGLDLNAKSRITSIELSYSLQRLLENEFFCIETSPEKCQSSSLIWNAYKFNDVELHKTVYNLMLLSQRERIHSIVATYYEMRFRHDLLRWESEISRHYLSSNNLSRKLGYLRINATRAISEHRTSDAIKILSNILKVCVGLNEWEILMLIARSTDSGDKIRSLYQAELHGGYDELTENPGEIFKSDYFHSNLVEILCPENQISSQQSQINFKKYSDFEESIKNTDLLIDVTTSLAEIGLLKLKLHLFGGEQLIALSLRILGVRVDQKLSVSKADLSGKKSSIKIRNPDYANKLRSILSYSFRFNCLGKGASFNSTDGSLADPKIKAKRSRNLLINVAHHVHIPIYLCSPGPLRNILLECMSQLAYISHLQGKREFVEDLVVAALNNCYNIQFPRFQFLSRLTNVLDDERVLMFRGKNGSQCYCQSQEDYCDSDLFLLNRLIGLLSISLKEAGKVSLHHLVRLLNKRPVFSEQKNRCCPKIPLIFILTKIQEESELT